MSIYNRIYHILIEGQTDWSQEEEGDDFERTSKAARGPSTSRSTPPLPLRSRFWHKRKTQHQAREFNQQQKRKAEEVRKNVQRKWPEGKKPT